MIWCIEEPFISIGTYSSIEKQNSSSYSVIIKFDGIHHVHEINIF